MLVVSVDLCAQIHLHGIGRATALEREDQNQMKARWQPLMPMCSV